MNNEIYLIGLSYKTAPVEIREAYALSDKSFLESSIIPDDSGILESLVISTCNRVEILAVAPNDEAIDVPALISEYWSHAVNKKASELSRYLYIYKGTEAIAHLFSVASSLDSMVLGEPQILGQLKDAYRTALSQNTAKVIISRLMHKSFSVAKRVRSETAIAASAVSISYAAIELAKRIFDDMSNINALLIGAGEMAELSATYLINSGIKSISVVNRTFIRAEELAERFKGSAVPFERLHEILVDVDIVISSTAANEPILTVTEMKNVMKKRKNKPMFFIDIAVPRDIAADVNTLDNIYLYDIDDLKDVVNENLANRKQEAQKAEQIIQEEMKSFKSWLKSLALQPTIVDLLERNNEIVTIELEKTIKQLGHLSEEQHKLLETMLSAIVKKINHAPISFLKRHLDQEEEVTKSISHIRRLFDLDNEETTRLIGRCGGRKHKKAKNESV